jgi:hypothetical protein
MVKAKSVAGLIIAATIAMTLFSPVLATVNTATGSQAVTNETFSAQTGTYVDLDGYDIDKGSETVYAFNDTSNSYETVSEGTAYEMNYSAGSIKALSGSHQLDDGEDAKITYGYQATDGTTATIAALVPTFMALLVVGVFASKITGAM